MRHWEETQLIRLLFRLSRLLTVDRSATHQRSDPFLLRHSPLPPLHSPSLPTLAMSRSVLRLQPLVCGGSRLSLAAGLRGAILRSRRAILASAAAASTPALAVAHLPAHLAASSLPAASFHTQRILAAGDVPVPVYEARPPPKQLAQSQAHKHTGAQADRQFSTRCCGQQVCSLFCSSCVLLAVIRRCVCQKFRRIQANVQSQPVRSRRLLARDGREPRGLVRAVQECAQRQCDRGTMVRWRKAQCELQLRRPTCK